MVYKIKLVSDEADHFARVIEIDSEATFLNLHDAVLDSVGYTKDDITSFFMCDEDWQKGVEITQVAMDLSSDRDNWLMNETRLDEMLEEEGDRLIFVFDYLTERSFFMELKEIIPGKSLEAPICTLKKGTPPKQNVDLDVFDAELDAYSRKANLDDQTLAALGIEGIEDFELGNLNIDDPLDGDTINLDDIEL